MSARKHPQHVLDDEDESVRIAVRALGDMRNSVHTSPSACELHLFRVNLPSNLISNYRLSHLCLEAFQPTPALSITSRSSSPSLPSPSLSRTEKDDRGIAGNGSDEDFVSRVSSFPIVSGALRAYEQSKASSRVVKVRSFPAMSGCVSS